MRAPASHNILRSRLIAAILSEACKGLWEARRQSFRSYASKGHLAAAATLVPVLGSRRAARITPPSRIYNPFRQASQECAIQQTLHLVSACWGMGANIDP
jgi:hypothetical protein